MMIQVLMDAQSQTDDAAAFMVCDVLSSCEDFIDSLICMLHAFKVLEGVMSYFFNYANRE
jgi:hypothetical protein